MKTNNYQHFLDNVKTASIVDAMGRSYSHRAHILDLCSPTPDRVLFGPAVTISFLPYRSDLPDPERYTFARLYYEAVGDNPEGKVLVMSSSGHPEISMAGGTKLSRLENQGLAGLLCDGRLRDFDELSAYGFTVFCNGEATRWGGDVLMPFVANIPIVLDGITVFPGDYVFADCSGAVIIPGSDVQDILEEAMRVEDEDARSMEQIRREDRSEVMKRGGR